LVALDPENVSAKRNLMLGYGHLGDVLGYPDLPNLGEKDKAERVYAKVVALAREIQFADPKDARGAQDAAIALMRWATVTSSLGDKEARLKASLALVRERLEASPGNMTMITYEAVIENQIGATVLAAGRAAEAVPHWRRSLDVVAPYLAKGDQGHIRALLQSTLRLSQHEPVAELRANGPARLARALALAEKVTAGAKGPDDISARVILPRAQAAHAYYYSRIGDAAQAAAWRQKALDGWKELSSRKGFQRVYRDEMQEIEKWRP
jgi:tetratricopeptide (TPR) repeat protein